MAKSAGGQGFGRVTSQQAEVQVGAALVHAVSEAIVTQAFKSAVQENGWVHRYRFEEKHPDLHASHERYFASQKAQPKVNTIRIA